MHPTRANILGRSSHGFSLIETLVGVAVFAVIAVSVYGGYKVVYDIARQARLKVTSLALANEQLEIVRNLPYADVGIVGGLPAGKIPHVQTNVSGSPFTVQTTVRNIDDPFDGTIGGTPNDTSPADYKLVELDISCATCPQFRPFSVTTFVGPKNLESASTNGALFVRVFDSNGQPIQGANVHIENNEESPAIVIDDTTNNDGMLQVVDAPPGVEAYEITVTKAGYSTDRTYTSGAPENPNPTKPHATVVQGGVTQLSFAIDRVSTLHVATTTDTCAAVGDMNFTLFGAKLIGTDPDVRKYDEDFTTNGSGEATVGNLEWDSYDATLASADHDLMGSIPLLPFALAPDSEQDVTLVVAPKEPRSLLVTVQDAGTRLPLSSSTVTLERTGYSETLTTGRGFLRQTDWSGGPGQTDFVNVTRYFSDDGNIDNNPPGSGGEVELKKTQGRYATSGVLESSIFDTGSESDFHQILWQPQDQPAETGPDSLTFQVATNKNKNAAWVYKGPDGTGNTYYTASGETLNQQHNKDRYFRYRVFLSTADAKSTPNLAEVAFTFTSSCTPPGQVIFTGLDAGDYTLTVTQSSYQNFSETVTVSADWQKREILLTPS